MSRSEAGRDSSLLNVWSSVERQRGLEIVSEFNDRISGTKSKRPGLDDLLADARRAKFDVVLVWACDRIARSTRHFLEVLDELNHLNVISCLSARTSIARGRCVPSITVACPVGNRQEIAISIVSRRAESSS